MFLTSRAVVSTSLIAVSLAISACNGSMFASSGLAPKKSPSRSNDASGVSVADTGVINIEVLWDSLAEASFDDLQSVLMSDYIAAVTARMSNEPIDIEGQTFVDLKDFTVSYEDLYLTISDNYNTVGELFTAFEITNITDIVPEKVASGYQTLADARDSGRLDKFLSDATSVNHSAGADTVDADLPSLALQDNDGLLKTAVAMALLLPQAAGTGLALLQDAAPVVAAASADKANTCFSIFGKCTNPNDEHVSLNPFKPPRDETPRLPGLPHD